MAESNGTLKFRLLRADEIDVRVGMTSKKDAQRPWYSLLLYKDARCDMAILDETVGALNWDRSHRVVKENLYCTVGIRGADGTWTYKEDVGVESFAEKEKGESSDSFKRACVNWGIGRELYTSPQMFISEDPNFAKRRFFFVKEITYNENGTIKRVVIGDYKNPDFVKTFS